MNKMVTCQPQEKKKNTTVQFIQVFQLNYLYGTNNHDFLTQKKKKKKPLFCNRNLSLHMH